MTTFPTADLHPHPEADLVPWADSDSHADLMADIEANGIQVPVDALPDGTVLDGRTRLAIARVLGMAEVPVRWVEPADPVAYMVRMALRRRHLTTAQRKVLAASLMRTNPDRSDRGIAHDTGLSHPTVSHVRAELEASGDVERLSTRTDTLGRQQPATKPERDPWPEALADPETVAAMEAGLRQVEAGQTVPRPVKRSDLPMTAAHRERFPDVAAAELSADLSKAIAATRTDLLAPARWADRIEQMRPEDIENVRQKVAHVRHWATEWDALLAPRPLAIVGGSRP